MNTALLVSLCGGAAVFAIVAGLSRKKSTLESLSAALDIETRRRSSRGAELYDQLQRNLALAGWNFNVSELMWFVLLGGGLVSLLFIVAGHLGIFGVPCGFGIVVLMGYFFMRISQVRREAKVERQLVQVLIMVTGLMGSSGATVDRALREAAARTPAPLGPELVRIAKGVEVNRDFGALLEEAGTRLGSKEWGFFTKAVQLQESRGGDLPKMLHKLSETITHRIRSRGEARSLLSEAQMSKYFLSAAVPGAAALLAVENPSQFHALLGHDLWMLITAGVLWGLGILAINFMVRKIQF